MRSQSRPGRVTLAVVAAVAVAVTGTTIALRLHATSAATARVAVQVTRPAGSSPLAVDSVDLGTIRIVAGLHPPAAPAHTDPVVVDVGSGPVDAVTVRVAGRTLTARARALLDAGSLRPLLVVTDGETATAAWGNVAVNDALAVAAGTLPRPPDVTFTDQTGAVVPWASLRGTVLVAAALDTGCSDTCPLYTAVLQDTERVLRARGWTARVRIVDISMDPERDTPAELTAYGERFGAEWSLLRADPAPTQAFWSSLHASYVRLPADPGSVDWYTGQPPAYHLHHDSLAFVVDPGGVVRSVLQGVPRLGHGLTPALAAQLAPGASPASRQPLASWTVTDLLDRVDAALGEPEEADRGVEQAAHVGAAAPDIALPSAQGGGTVSLHDAVGHPVVISFMASWCDPCRRELPLLAAAARNDPRLSLFLVDEGESAAQARDFVRAVLGGSPPAGTAVVVDGDRSAGGVYAATGLPVSVFVDSGGTVRATHVGELDGDSLHTALLAAAA